MATVQANIDFGGPSRAGQQVAVYQHGTTTPVSIFDHDGVTPLANPVTTTGNGRVVFQAAAGTYDLVGPDLTRTVVLTADSALYLPQPATAAIAGQLYGSDGAGNTVAVNPSGSSELAYAENNTGTTQTGIGATLTDVTGCSIAVPASLRPVYLSAQATFTASAGGATVAGNLSIVEVSNGVDTPITIASSVALPGTSFASGAIPLTRLAGSTARTRTFKLQVSVNSGTVTVHNGHFSLRSLILATAM